jgi:hypothetical protein
MLRGVTRPQMTEQNPNTESHSLNDQSVDHVDSAPPTQRLIRAKIASYLFSTSSTSPSRDVANRSKNEATLTTPPPKLPERHHAVHRKEAPLRSFHR